MKIKKMAVALILSAFVLSLTAGCGLGNKQEAPAGPNYGIDKFVIVHLPQEANPSWYATRKIWSDPLSEAIGIPVEEYIGTDYNALVEAMRTGHAHASFFGPFTYVQATERSDAQALTVTGIWNEELQKYTHGYYSMIITRTDSGIDTLDDLVGRTFGFVDPASTSGMIVPGNELLNYFNADKYPDLTFDDLQINGKLFSAVSFTGNHNNSINGVFLGDIDAAGVASTTLASMINQGIVDGDQIKIIQTSPLIPSDPFAVKGSLPQELKDKILQFLLDFDDPAWWGEDSLNRYIEIDDSEYDYLRELNERYFQD